MRQFKLNRALILLAASCVLLLGVGTIWASPITIQTVTVGNPGNAADTTGYGAVPYTYNIGTYDVTSSQYTAFLNAVAATDTYSCYNSAMSGTTTGNPGIIQSGSSGSYTYSVTGPRANNPVTDVTFWNACRFANWLNNGQPTGPEGTGTTETGTYSLNGVTNPVNSTITRNPGATWAVTSENEWYKAAYYTPLGGTGNSNPNYWLYPTQSNTISTSQANYDSAVGDTTPVGSYDYPSYYGTYDQAGDVDQWNESIYESTERGYRGGTFADGPTSASLSSGEYGILAPSLDYSDFGFRVSNDPDGFPVPEPASFGILAFGMLGLLVRRRGARR